MYVCITGHYILAKINIDKFLKRLTFVIKIYLMQEVIFVINDK